MSSFVVRGLAGVIVAVLLSGAALAAHRSAATTPAPTRSAAPTATPRPVDLAGAVTAVNDTRTRALHDAADLDADATFLDRIDAAAAKGDPAAVPDQGSVAGVNARAHAVLRRMPGDVQAYADSLGALARAVDRSAVGAGRRAALRGVVRAGTAEWTALAEFAHTAARSWTSYDVLAAQEPVWYDRAVSGWYRSRREAADAYAVALTSVRSALGRARHTLAVADAGREKASAAVSAAIRAVDGS